MAKKIIIEVEQTFSIYNDDNNLISKVKCVKDIHHNDCRLCIFEKTNTCDNMICNEWMRPDRENVHFEYVEL